MTWATRRQVFFFFVFFWAFVILAFIGYQAFLNRPPTCFDGKQNGAEAGVDCGGVCILACPKEVDKISVLWSRAFEILPSRYNAVAYVENKNENTVVRKINYSFRFSDVDNVFIGKREGSTYVPPASKFAIFEPNINFGISAPVYTTFTFTEELVWEKVDPQLVSQLQVGVGDVVLTDVSTTPKLFASLRNYSLFRIPEVSAVAILYDAEGNAISASRTVVDVLTKEASQSVSFTWPRPFGRDPVVKEIIPMYDISSVELE